jgi:PhoPQ-activated pathogenicity-related protein
MRIRILFGILFGWLGLQTLSYADLNEYVKKADSTYSWKLKETQKLPQGNIYVIRMVSQTWHDIKWEHDLVIYQPKDVKPQATMFLWNTSGRSPSTDLLALDMATRTKSPVAFLYGVPNQPLYGGKKEDALIAETFVRYLETKDGSWPLLFPMVKSVVRSMDTVQAFAKKEWKFDVKHFVVSGASKRGWTSWLTAATEDPRVKAIAPMVIDTLNMKAQLPYQIKSYGKPSDMIRDYTDRKLAPIPDTPEAQKLWSMVDPWIYREKLTLPKMIINGANDPYWTQDALNLYWDDLQGDKWVLYVPNAAHNVEQTYEKKKGGDRERALGTLAAFIYCQIHDKSFPKLTWKHGELEDKLLVTLGSEPPMKAARLWVTDSKTRDFRQSIWKEQPVTMSKSAMVGLVSRPEKGNRAFFAECEHEVDGLKYYLSTQIRIVESAK